VMYASKKGTDCFSNYCLVIIAIINNMEKNNLKFLDSFSLKKVTL